MNKTILFAMMLSLSVLLFACAEKTDDSLTLVDDLDDVLIDLPSINETGVVDEDTIPVSGVDESKAAYTIEAVEGELVKIPVMGFDPDGGVVSLAFSNPFNDEGLWLTKIGDEGRHLVKVSVTDGLLTTSEYVLVIIHRANRPPVVNCPEKIVVQETENVKIDCNIFDEDGDPVIVAYEGWMKSSTKETTYGDAGNYSVLVRARDAENEVTRVINIIVEKKNRAPVIEPITELRVMETELITVNPVVSDPDGDAVIVSFSAPLDASGSWVPEFGDRGTYEVIITATDGVDTTMETFNLVVERRNRAPVIKPISSITVYEGEVVNIDVQAYDPDGDEIFISYSGWMNSNIYQTTYDDAHPLGCGETGCMATYNVIVTVSDGVLETHEVVVVNVIDKNRPPELIFG